MAVSQERFREALDIIGEMSLEQLNQVIPLFNTAIKKSRAVNNAKALAELQVGDRVRLGGLKPAYLNGCRGIIVKFNPTRVQVKIDPIGKFSSGTVIVSPASLTKLED